MPREQLPVIEENGRRTIWCGLAFSACRKRSRREGEGKDYIRKQLLPSAGKAACRYRYHLRIIILWKRYGIFMPLLFPCLRSKFFTNPWYNGHDRNGGSRSVHSRAAADRGCGREFAFWQTPKLDDLYGKIISCLRDKTEFGGRLCITQRLI